MTNKTRMKELSELKKIGKRRFCGCEKKELYVNILHI